MNTTNILLAGSTGMVGGLSLRQLLADKSFRGIVFAPSRHAPDVSDSRLLSPELDMSATGTGDGGLEVQMQRVLQQPLDLFISCLGTTIRAAGSRAAFIAVDRELVLRLARFAFDRGARRAILVSSAGASRQSANFYLRVKGEVEDALEKAGFDRLDIIQPGLLLGERAQRRTLEAVAQRVAPLTNLAMQGRFTQYRAVPAEDVARAIVTLSLRTEAGLYVHRYDSIRALSEAI